MMTNDNTDRNTRTAVWGAIDTMRALQPLPGITMWPAAGTHLMMNFVRIEPGTSIPLHSHPHEQAGTVIEGSIEVTIEGETRELHTGDLYIAPPYSEHSATAGSAGCLVIDVFSPPREDYLIPSE